MEISDSLTGRVTRKYPLLKLELSSNSFSYIYVDRPTVIHILDRTVSRIPQKNRVLPSVIVVLVDRNECQETNVLTSLYSNSSLITNHMLSRPLRLVSTNRLNLTVAISGRYTRSVSSITQVILSMLKIPSPGGQVQNVTPKGSHTVPEGARLRIQLLRLYRNVRSRTDLTRVTSSLSRLRPRMLGLGSPLSSGLCRRIHSLLLTVGNTSLRTFHRLILIRRLERRPGRNPSLFSTLLYHSFRVLKLVVNDPIDRESSILFEATSGLLTRTNVATLSRRTETVYRLSRVITKRQGSVRGRGHILVH